LSNDTKVCYPNFPDWDWLGQGKTVTEAGGRQQGGREVLQFFTTFASFDKQTFILSSCLNNRV